jgi:selenocysteine-specific elongation factor
MSIDLILGTAGHIDHGKTTLIRCLTGTDTDRLPEEKRRGITIELGFAELVVGQYRLGIVDVPGHERFVRQMLAGATGMDLAMLVVAADDSVKPQTREHLDVLRLLDVQAGVIALTKTDMADPEWISLVEDEVRELVGGTFLADAPIVRTSAPLGQGLDELKDALRTAAARAAPVAAARLQAPFRMAIDRAFTVVGHGTVVTGSVSTGQISVGDRLLVEPGGIEVRVRGLHNHDREVQQVSRGQRAAVNLAGIHHGQLRRGHELAAPGHLVPSRWLTCQIAMLSSAPRPLKARDRVRLHVGTAEVLASVVPVGGGPIGPGQTAPAQLFLNEPVVTTWNQPFVLRSESPVTTIAGGHVLVPVAGKLRRPSADVLKRLNDLTSSDPLARASSAVYFGGSGIRGGQDFARVAGIDDARPVVAELRARGELLVLSVSDHRQVYVHAQRLDESAERVVNVLSKWHDQHPLQIGVERSSLIHQFADMGDAVVVETVLAQMQKAGRLRVTDRLVGLADRGPQLSKGEQELLGQLIARYKAAGFQPPSLKECEQAATKHQKSIRSLLTLATGNGDLVEIGDGLYLHAETERELRRRLSEAFAERPELTMSEIREILGTSRKYGIPISEYLDRVGFTRREGDLRRLSSTPGGATV